MNILLIAECSKNALVETRRILDQFAERKGERTWQTAITLEGLNTLRKLLRRSARRNTAVACHWLKAGGQSELLWIVGNLGRFNEQGTVPTNSTSSDILKTQDENHWHTAEAMALLAGLAGLFHDFGKANALFQHKLLPGSPLSSEPYRHEWISLRLFQAFVAERDDRTWLTELAAIKQDRDLSLRVALQRYQEKTGAEGSNPFRHLPPLAQVIGWLIVSHHRLPQFVKQEVSPLGAPSLEKLQRPDSSRLDASWISPQSVQSEWTPADWLRVWDLSVGTPMASASWCAKARDMAGRALRLPSLWQATDWLSDRFSSHLARLSLMLADHSYSAGPATLKWQDREYQAYANTDRATGQRKQKLDEHNIGVGLNAVLLARRLPKLRRHLPAITRHKGFKQRSQHEAFRWQDKAFDLARCLAQPSSQQGFFGINMASTGCGKTFANARIMYGLADEKLGCRFSIALGLRTLTLQTGDALQARLHLETDDLAVLIGSQSVQQLHVLRKEEEKTQAAARGSESADSLCDELQHVRYEGSLDDGPLRHWLKQSDKLHQLISAPVLVSTIDHLIPATEGTRGGKQIAPMLRLLTSDLVLDEPDDFDLADLPALCRLVNWAGMLGSRVLLSSATLPPALLCALFEAYQSGRQHFNRACCEPGTSSEICCAWFDEFGCEQGLMASRDNFKASHNGFVEKRMAQLDKAVSSKLRRAALLPVSTLSTKPVDVVSGVAEALYQGMFQLHQQHHQSHAASGKTVSIGLIRMANINPLVAVSQRLLDMAPPDEMRVHICIYHSQHPMLVRSRMEARLDKALTRHDPDSLWLLPEIQAALQQPERHHLFVVVASAVAEVGRDHDYDWAIAEPSSMRSLIQLAGRIQRHRKQLPSTPNLLILQKNFKALSGKTPAYCQPGFESKQEYSPKGAGLPGQAPFLLKTHDLGQILLPQQFEYISANPRIRSPETLKADENLVALEHRHLALRLFGSLQLHVDDFAAQWWQLDLHWCAEAQRRSRFRDSDRDECFVLYQQEEGDEPAFYRLDEWGDTSKVDQSEFQHQCFALAQGIQAWINNDSATQVADVAERLDRDIGWVSLRYTELRLGLRREGDVRQWHYDPLFGVYDAV
jgi:CRISPR-associated endonuclease/helicase Cas3